MRYPPSSRSARDGPAISAARQIPLGLDSSSTNIATDHALLNPRRSMATTCGRSAYVRRRTSMAAAGGAVKLILGRGHGVRLAAVVRKQGVAVDGLARPSQPAHHQRADAVGTRTVARHRHSGPL